jgi:hypothetical protein
MGGEGVIRQGNEMNMEKFGFLLGEWEMVYDIPKSDFSDATTGTGYGIFKRALDEKYVVFDYSSLIDGKEGHAHAIFVWDEREEIFRFWWFESSGNYRTATCNFINDDTLLIHWHDTLLIQSFQKTGSDQVMLRMESPDSEGNYRSVLNVVFSKKH